VEKDDALRVIKRRAADFYRCFDSDLGASVLLELEKSFGGESYTRGDNFHTAYREGQRSVLVQIRRLVESGKNPEQIRLKTAETE
tara:strand:+ start:149 stop:403 length:255 start_codon:yes stop_codon:yes gene_type:complete